MIDARHEAFLVLVRELRALGAVVVQDGDLRAQFASPAVTMANPNERTEREGKKEPRDMTSSDVRAAILDLAAKHG